MELDSKIVNLQIVVFIVPGESHVPLPKYTRSLQYKNPSNHIGMLGPKPVSVLSRARR